MCKSTEYPLYIIFTLSSQCQCLVGQRTPEIVRMLHIHSFRKRLKQGKTISQDNYYQSMNKGGALGKLAQVGIYSFINYISPINNILDELCIYPYLNAIFHLYFVDTAMLCIRKEVCLYINIPEL